MSCSLSVVYPMSSMLFYFVVCFFKQKTAYEMRISDWSSDVCSSDLTREEIGEAFGITPGKVRDYTNTIREWLGTNPSTTEPHLPHADKIGRASCRERVCKYV